MNIRIAKSYRTVSNEDLCIITGLIPIDIKKEETAQPLQITNRNERQYNRKINWPQNNQKTGCTLLTQSGLLNTTKNATYKYSQTAASASTV
jgi:hypothetical protein